MKRDVLWCLVDVSDLRRRLIGREFTIFSGLRVLFSGRRCVGQVYVGGVTSELIFQCCDGSFFNACVFVE